MLPLAWPLQPPGTGVCVSDWVVLGVLVGSPLPVPGGLAVLPLVVSGLWRAWRAAAAASGLAQPLALDGVELGRPSLVAAVRACPSA